MATAVEDGLSRLSLTDSNEPHLASLSAPNQLDAINLVLTVEKPNAITKTEFQVFAEETIHELKIRLRKKEFFTNKYALVFGHRELLEDETIGQLASQSGAGHYLHIVAKLSDIEELEVTTNKQKRVMKNDRQMPMGALSNYFKNDASASMNATCPLLLCGRVMDNGQKLSNPEIESRHGDPIVHLIIRKSSKVHWHHFKGERFELRISADATVDEVKRKVEEVTVGFEANEHAIVKAGHTLQPGMSLAELGVQKGDVLEMVCHPPLCLEEFPEPSSPKMSPKSEMPFEWEKAKDALAQGVRPKLTSVGTGGSYFISALEGMNLAVFKPEDEEPQAPNNPKGHRGSPTGDGLRKGVRPGEGATREVIAFTLDHEHFSGVPPTTMASLKDCRSSTSHRKVGSFQQFVQHDVDCEEMGPSNFPVHEVHKICVLDIRLANTDRNAGNILASRKEGQWELTPIDHGYCLPDSFEDINFEWMYWPQAKVPFDSTTRQYIEKLDAKHDLDLLSKANLTLRPACVRVFRVCTMLLKKALSHGLTPHQIACIMCRQSLNMSPLEKLNKGAIKLTLGKMYGTSNVTGSRLELDENLYLETMSNVIDQYLEETHVL